MAEMQKPLLIYLSPYDILRPRTNQVSDVRFTEGFAQNGCDAHLIVPFVERPDNIRKEDVYPTYGLDASVNIHYLPTSFSNDVHGKKQLFLVAWHCIWQCIRILKNKKPHQKIYIISRSTHLLRPCFLLRKLMPRTFENCKLIHWAHDFHTGKMYSAIYKKSDYLLATNSSILNELLKITSRKQGSGGITLNPITEKQARQHISKADARRETGLEYIKKPLIVYTGKLGTHYDKEIIFILTAASLLPDYQFLLTGGKPETVAYWEDYSKNKKIQNVIFTGYLYDYSKIILYQHAADVLLSYYTSQGHDVRYNLPNKICEYMLSGNVIITPDYPATADLLNPDNCIFTKAEDAIALADSIRFAIENPEIAGKKAANAARDVKEITFKKISAKLLQQFP